MFDEFAEPITTIARLYQKDLGTDEVVAELSKLAWRVLGLRERDG